MNLRNYGFVRVGRWKLNKSNDKSNKSEIDFELNDLDKERVIYAFVVGDKVKYIGICESSKTTLENRMIKFKNRQGGGTNKRIADEIERCLKNGKTVEIFVLKPKLSVFYKGLVEIDIIIGLEYPLIKKLKPEWNIKKN